MYLSIYDFNVSSLLLTQKTNTHAEEKSRLQYFLSYLTNDFVTAFKVYYIYCMCVVLLIHYASRIIGVEKHKRIMLEQ